MDGGIDDALAIVLALRSPELEISGITAVSGNVPVEQATVNALRVVELLDRTDVWVARGLANPLVRDPIRATDFHGLDGLGDSDLPQPSARPSEKNALDLMTEEIAGRKNKLSIIATGPLTNIAALFTKEPDIPHMLDEIVIMGGAYGVTEYGIGNETPVAEFNIYSDPEAAKIVFESGVPLKAVGLDVTMIPDAQLSMKEYMRICRSKTKTATFASRILANTMRKWKRFALHDPMAVAAKAKPSMFKFEGSPVKIETKGEYTTGMTVVDRRSSQQDDKRSSLKIRICGAVESRQFKESVLKSII
jgi:inosine-uridine nucleoside N-ribohydrolase